MSKPIFEGKNIFVQIHESEIPWLKIFTKKQIKEFSDCDFETKNEIMTALDIIEKEMISYYDPTKINIASFGNYLPHLHFHIMARFDDDSYFPEPMWGKKMRESECHLGDFDTFLHNIITKLQLV